MWECESEDVGTCGGVSEGVGACGDVRVRVWVHVGV